MAVVLLQAEHQVRSEAAAKSSRSLVRSTGDLQRFGCRNFGVATTPVRDGLGHLRADAPPSAISGQVTSAQVSNPITPAVTAGVTPTAPAQTQAADGVNQIGLNGVVTNAGGQTSAIEPAVTPGVTPSVPSLAGFGVNSPPTASAPATASLNENSLLSFSTANSNAISITDAAAGTNADSLTLSVSEGTLTLPSTTGLNFTAGANGSSSVTVSGTVADLDSALDGLVYQPTTLYSGADSLAVSVSDLSDSLSASTSVSITVAALRRRRSPLRRSLLREGALSARMAL